MQMRRVGMRVLLAAGLVSLTGCGDFFVCQKASCPATSTTTTSSTTTNYAYVSNSASGATYINGYSLASGNLTTATTNSPYLLGYTPVAMAVTPANTFLYAAVDAALSSSGGMYVYTIGTGGALTLANSGNAVASGSYTAMSISPDGDWLFALDTTGYVLYEFQVNASTGGLTLGNTISITPGNTNAVTPVAVKVAPTADFVVATLGTAGDVIYSFNTSTGLLGATISTISTGSATAGDYAVTIDASDDIYLARTTGLAVYTATSLGAPTQVNLYTAGNGPHAVAVVGTAGYAYVGNQSDSTISGYTVASGPRLTAFSATIAAPSTVGSMALDKSGTYLLANGYNAGSGLELYTIGSAGGLTAAGSVGTGTATTVPAVMALTH